MDLRLSVHAAVAAATAAAAAATATPAANAGERHVPTTGSLPNECAMGTVEQSCDH